MHDAAQHDRRDCVAGLGAGMATLVCHRAQEFR